MPEHPHPAQIEDVAAAFAWVYRNIAQHGGDVKRIYLVGHSAGAHLAALLALDNDYLKKYDIPFGAIRGVAAMSGVYDLSPLPVFQPVNGRRDGSPLHFVHSQAPPFLITFCQWDYPGLPKQAREFETALRRAFVTAKLVYIPGQSHMSEVLNIWKDDDPLALAILDFVQ
jgi:acetyl esterase/lipase